MLKPRADSANVAVPRLTTLGGKNAAKRCRAGGSKKRGHESLKERPCGERRLLVGARHTCATGHHSVLQLFPLKESLESWALSRACHQAEARKERCR